MLRVILDGSVMSQFPMIANTQQSKIISVMTQRTHVEFETNEGKLWEMTNLKFRAV